MSILDAAKRSSRRRHEMTTIPQVLELLARIIESSEEG